MFSPNAQGLLIEAIVLLFGIGFWVFGGILVSLALDAERRSPKLHLVLLLLGPLSILAAVLFGGIWVLVEAIKNVVREFKEENKSESS